MEICLSNGIPCQEADLSLSEFYNADGVFATGTMGELTPVVEIDGRVIAKDHPDLQHVLGLFKTSIRNFCQPLNY